MVTNCAAYKCKSKAEEHSNTISFHQFPKDTELCKAWMHLAQIKFIYEEACLCDKHFKKDDFEIVCGIKLLKKGVTPSIFNLSNSDDVLLEQELTNNVYVDKVVDEPGQQQSFQGVFIKELKKEGVQTYEGTSIKQEEELPTIGVVDEVKLELEQTYECIFIKEELPTIEVVDEVKLELEQELSDIEEVDKLELQQPSLKQPSTSSNVNIGAQLPETPLLEKCIELQSSNVGRPRRYRRSTIKHYSDIDEEYLAEASPSKLRRVFECGTATINTHNRTIKELKQKYAGLQKRIEELSELVAHLRECQPDHNK